MKSGKITHHAFILILFVGMNSLCMLTEVIETRKLFGAVTSKRTLSSVFSVIKKAEEGNKREKEQSVPDVTRKVFAPGEHHATFTIAPALKSFRRSRPGAPQARLRLLLLLLCLLLLGVRRNRHRYFFRIFRRRQVHEGGWKETKVPYSPLESKLPRNKAEFESHPFGAWQCR